METFEEKKNYFSCNPILFRVLVIGCKKLSTINLGFQGKSFLSCKSQFYFCSCFGKQSAVFLSTIKLYWFPIQYVNFYFYTADIYCLCNPLFNVLAALLVFLIPLLIFSFSEVCQKFFFFA